MSQIVFPNPRTHEFSEWVLFGDYFYNARDIIGFGGEMNVGNLFEAYRHGIFPWHIDGLPLPWFCPAKRAILEFDELHVPRSLRKAYRGTRLVFSIDTYFAQVIEKCANAKRSDEGGTWITDEFIRAYTRFHRAGHAHSVEVRDDEGNLVGGLYGVDTGGVFCGESMFFEVPNASKFALLFLIDHLRSRGSTWMDIQVMTPHFRVLGAKEIPRNEFLDRLEQVQDSGIVLFGETVSGQ